MLSTQLGRLCIKAADAILLVDRLVERLQVRLARKSSFAGSGLVPLSLLQGDTETSKQEVAEE